MAESTDRRLHWGVLALRLIAFFLVATIGWHKLLGLVTDLRAGKALAAIGAAPLIGKMGFPLPAVLALIIVLNESVGAFLVACGLLTRLAAFSVAMGMVGAFYTTIHFGWEPVRAFLYIFVFATLVITGAGRFSLDAKFFDWSEVTFSDCALLFLRCGMGAAIVLLLALPKASPLAGFPSGPAMVLVTTASAISIAALLGCYARQTSFLAALMWAYGAVSGLVAHKPWDLMPYRDDMFVFLFIVLAITGPGRYSLAGLRRR